jgi:cell division protein ZapA
MSNKQVEVGIAGQTYTFAVSPENEAALVEAAALVDGQMSRIKGGSTTKGVERVAVMAAISLASDLLALQRKQASESALPVDAIRAKIRELHDRTDEALRQYGQTNGAGQ